MTAPATIAWDIDAIDGSGGQRRISGDAEWRQITVDLGAAISVARKRMVENAPFDEPPNQRVYRAANGGQLPDLGWKKIRFVTAPGGAAGDELSHCLCDEALGVSIKDLRQGQPRGV